MLVDAERVAREQDGRRVRLLRAGPGPRSPLRPTARRGRRPAPRRCPSPGSRPHDAVLRLSRPPPPRAAGPARRARGPHERQVPRHRLDGQLLAIAVRPLVEVVERGGEPVDGRAPSSADLELVALPGVPQARGAMDRRPRRRHDSPTVASASCSSEPRRSRRTRSAASVPVEAQEGGARELERLVPLEQPAAPSRPRRPAARPRGARRASARAGSRARARRRRSQTSAKSRGSRPRSIETSRIARSISRLDDLVDAPGGAEARQLELARQPVRRPARAASRSSVIAPPAK